MNFSSSNNPRVYFWVVSLIALIWNGLGAYSFAVQALSTAEQFNEFSDTDEILAAHFPTWYLSVFGIAVFSGFLGSVFLLLRKRWAYSLFTIALIATGIQQFYVLTEVNPRDIFLSLSSLVIAVFLVWFSRRAIAKTWLQ